MKSGLLVGGFAALAIAAVAGWTRDTNAQSSLFAPQPYQELAGYDVNGQPVYEQRGVYSSQPQPQPIAAQPAVIRQTVRQPVVETAPAPAPRPAAVKTKRSTKKSVLIVAGSSGAGAAVGAIAGGKKGAAIGAISGGTAGFIYDRITANR